jgi:hypothetical protein
VGTDATAGRYNSGVKGVTQYGNGVLGTATSGFGVLGKSNNIGVSGTGGIGVLGNGQSIGVEGAGYNGVVAIGTGSGPALNITASGTGGGLIAGSNGSATVFTVDDLGGAYFDGLVNIRALNVSGTLNSGNEQTGQLIATANEIPIVAEITQSSGHPGIESLAMATPVHLFGGFDTNGNAVFDVDDSGNEHIAGQLTTGGPCRTGCIAGGAVARRVISYTPRESQPTMEDFGTAQLTGGRAHVALDAAFANVIDNDSNYLVFLTPEGNCKGLFYTHKTSSGFDVEELEGGSSSVAFDYRIVAKPFGDRSARLPMVSANAFGSRAAKRPPVRHTRG